MKLRIQSTYRNLDVDIGSTVKIRKDRRPVEDDAYSMYAVVVGVGFNLNEGVIWLDVVERFTQRQAYIGAASSPAWGSATADEKRILGFVTDDNGFAAANNNAAYKISQEF